MNGLIFDIYLELEYGDEDHKLSDTLIEGSKEIIKVSKTALSTAADYFDREIMPHCKFEVSDESIEIAEFLIETSIIILLNRV